MPQKPHADPGTTCPRFKKDVSKVCHTCHFYRSMPVDDPLKPGTVKEHWDCIDVLNVIITRNIVLRSEGIQQATEGLRNQVADTNSQTAAALLNNQQIANTKIEKVVERIAALPSEDQSFITIEDHRKNGDGE